MSEKSLQEDKAPVIEAEDQAIAQDLEGQEESQASVDLQAESQDQVNTQDTDESIDEMGPNPEMMRVKELENELEEAGQRYLRLQADFDNFRRRTREEKSQERKLRAQELVQDLLPVLDNFKRALEIETTNEETQGLKQGLEMVYRQFFDALKKEGVEEVEALNQLFDPNLHQAVMQEEADGVEPNKVVAVFQSGYSLNGRVIRPAMVKVSS
jgi:molecular chaperone GrpE